MVIVTVVSVVIAVVVILLLAGLVVLVAAARALVAPVRERRIAYRLVGSELIELPSTADTRLPGTFGLTIGNGHLRIGDLSPAGAGAPEHHVLRTTEVAQGPVPPSGSGWWRRDVFLNPGQAGLRFDDIDIPTELGASPAWLINPAAGNDTGVWVVHLHGIRTTRSVTIPTAICASRAGLVSLVPSWRNDGEGPTTKRRGSMLGEAEWRDADAAIDYAVDHGARQVILVGWSMGGQIALRLARRSRHRERIKSLVLIAPVLSWRAVLHNAVTAARLPSVVASAVTALMKHRWFTLVAGVADPVDLDTLDLQAQSAEPTVPCLVIHNPTDQLVPFQLSRDLVAHLEERDEGGAFVELDTFDDSPHALEWNCDRERFETRVTTWLRTITESRELDPIEERGAIPDGS